MPEARTLAIGGRMNCLRVGTGIGLGMLFLNKNKYWHSGQSECVQQDMWRAVAWDIEATKADQFPVSALTLSPSCFPLGTRMRMKPEDWHRKLKTCGGRWSLKLGQLQRHGRHYVRRQPLIEYPTASAAPAYGLQLNNITWFRVSPRYFNPNNRTPVKYWWRA